MAELVDAPGLGPGGLAPLEVRVLSPALPIEVRPATRAMTTSIGSYFSPLVREPQPRMSAAAATAPWITAATTGTWPPPNEGCIESRTEEESCRCDSSRRTGPADRPCQPRARARLPARSGSNRSEPPPSTGGAGCGVRPGTSRSAAAGGRAGGCVALLPRHDGRAARFHPRRARLKSWGIHWPPRQA